MVNRYELQHLNDDLAPEVRRLMIAELGWSLEHGKLYYSKHFAPPGYKEYPQLLAQSLGVSDPDGLEEALNEPGYFQPDAPKKAAQTFAWDEFNKYYMRGLCRLAQIVSGSELWVVRGRHSKNPKPESNRLLGTAKNPAAFLSGLREVPKVNPFGANSGLTLALGRSGDAASR
jgi:hypothetical protein